MKLVILLAALASITVAKPLDIGEAASVMEAGESVVVDLMLDDLEPAESKAYLDNKPKHQQRAARFIFMCLMINDACDVVAERIEEVRKKTAEAAAQGN